MRELYFIYSRWAFEQMLYQSMNSHALLVRTEKGNVNIGHLPKSKLLRPSEDGVYTVKDC